MISGVCCATGPLQLVAWTPVILSDFEIGQAMAAIEGVARLEKPLAEVGTRVASERDVELDLLHCLEMAGETGRVFPWVRRVGEHVRFGFYSEPWTLEALDFLERTPLQPSDRHWINGLLFGYRSSAIQRFISARSPEATPSRQPSNSCDRAETARLSAL